MPYPKSAALQLRGFSMSPSEVEELVGVKADRTLLKGQSVKPGVKTLAYRSAATFEVVFDPDEPLRNMLPALLSHLGGVDNLQRVRKVVDPEYIHFEVLLNLRISESWEDGFIENESLLSISALGATLGSAFTG